ncbi:MAG: glycine--tRNA ligase subunit beta [Deltaproteobacteria bacterium RBG_13_61_14]|nr:MAG: glycine--tRNA ligase subunit beta [Deltaproteobacteria bacterium RBG_13_61_14]
MSQDLLIEIGVEEIPAGFLPPALAKWQEAMERLLEDSRLDHGKATTYGTPRRMVLVVEQVAERQPDTEEVRSGPYVAQAFDAEGKPTRAGEGFAKSCGVSVSALEREATPKGEKLICRKQVPGQATLEILAGKLPDLIRGIPFPKAMRWGSGEFRFARPIHWVLALFGEDVVPFSLDGLASGRSTRGHRFTHPQAVEVKDLADYMEALDRAEVEVDPVVRQDQIEREIILRAEELGGEVIPDPALLEEVTWLVEWPVVVSGRFEDRFLKLPEEVLIEAMRAHQRYFALRQKGSSRLLPAFITVANTPVPDLSVVAEGNERVLKARLSDAEFFFREDSKVPLEKFAERLSGVVFQAKLGTYAEKSERIEKLAEWLAGELAPGDAKVREHAKRAARLCKADLVTQMVYEFPSLQGIMGGHYARISGEAPEVAQAICEHYLPRSAEDIEKGNLPQSVVGDIVSLADKMDSIVGCWGVGLAPTGSADAFAIRRQTLGILEIIEKKNHSISVYPLISQALEGVRGKIKQNPEEINNEIGGFFKERLRNRFDYELSMIATGGGKISSGRIDDVIAAVLSVWNGQVLDAWNRVLALWQFKNQHRADFDPLMIAFKRVVRIIEDEPGAVDPKLFEHETEKALYQEFKQIEKQVRPLLQEQKYGEALSEMAKLKPIVDQFFDDVMVNVADENLRRNRHALLAEIRAMFWEFADFSKIVTAG